MIRGAAARLTLTVDGTHFFFVGKPGARRAARGIVALATAAAHLQQSIQSLLA